MFAEKTAFAKGPGAKCWARQIAHAAGVPAVPANPAPISRGSSTKPPLLLSAATRTATNARRRRGKTRRSQGVEHANSKHKGQRERNVVLPMPYLAITSREARKNQVGLKASPTSTQWLASEESVGYYRATPRDVARLKVVTGDQLCGRRTMHHSTRPVALHCISQTRFDSRIGS